MISYFVGHGGSLIRGIKMGIQIAIFHVLSAIIVVWTTDFVVRQVSGQPPSGLRLIRLFSYGFIAVIGLSMFVSAVRSVGMVVKHTYHNAGCACSHHHPVKGIGGWLALAVGSIPCTGAVLVLLFGLANGMLGLAILLVAFISVGMAVAMAGIGVLTILGQNLADRKLVSSSGKHMWVMTALRLVGASMILTIGLALFFITLSGNQSNDMQKAVLGVKDIMTIENQSSLKTEVR